MAAIAITGALVVPLQATASGPRTTKPIGYIYAGSIFAGLYTLAVAPNDTMTVVKNTPSPSGDIGGIAVLHSKAGLNLYVLGGPFGGIGSIYQYSVSTRTGAITLTKYAPIPGVLASLRGNNLLAYDGRGINPSFTSVIYADVCADKACSHYGLAGFRADPTTGVLKELAAPGSQFIDSDSISGRRIAVLAAPQSGPGRVITSALIDTRRVVSSRWELPIGSSTNRVKPSAATTSPPATASVLTASASTTLRRLASSRAPATTA